MSRKEDPSSSEYEVGYGKPPVSSRFKPGESGNPSGKKKPTPSIRDQIDQLLARKIDATENGRPVKISVQKAILTKMTDQALRGDSKAVVLLLTLRNAPQADKTTTIDPAVLAVDDQALLRKYAQDALDRSEAISTEILTPAPAAEPVPAPTAAETSPAPKGPPIRVYRNV